MTQNKDKELMEDVYKAYFQRGHGNSRYFNFNIYPLIKDFSFSEFLSNNAKTEHGGILVITNQQYVIGYTAEFGIGTHKAMAARIMKDLTGGGYIKDILEARFLESNLVKNYITARIVYEYKGDNANGSPTYSGAVYFQLPKDDFITLEQFKVFKQFYDDYNKELEILIRKYGIDKFNIQFGCLDESGTKIIKTINNLNELYTYLEKRINYNKTIEDSSEVILGIVPNAENIKQKKLITK